MQFKFFRNIFPIKSKKTIDKKLLIDSKLTHSLLLQCYENDFGIDLQKIHYSNTNSSIDENLLIEEINMSNRIIFQHDANTQFKIVRYNGLNYLLGEKSIFPCSSVVNSALGKEFNWVRCYVIPRNNQVICESDITKSAIITSFFDDYVRTINDDEIFRKFVSGVEQTYKCNEWFDRNSFITNYYRKVSFWTTQEKIDNIFDEGLVSPRKYLSYLIFKKMKLNSEKIIHTFYKSLSQTTLKIIPFKEFEKFIVKMTENEIDVFFGFDYIKSQINTELLSYDLFADQLVIDMDKRYGDKVYSTDLINRIRLQDTLLYKSLECKKEYYNIIKKNYRDLENHIRMESGYDDVGSFVMEKHLFLKLKKELPNMVVITQHSPKWLQGQRFDIFIKEINVAIEYNGIQHFNPVDYFGGMEGLENTIILDKLKEKRSMENNVCLLTINYDQDFDLRYMEIINIIKQKIAAYYP